MRITWNLQGFADLRNTNEMDAVLSDHAERICDAANAQAGDDYYEVKAGGTPDRIRYFVATVANDLAGKAIRHEQRWATLEGAVFLAD